MKASVIVSTYNRANVLKRSLSAMLGQSEKSFEIIVIDDASKDNTREVLKRFEKEKKMDMILIDKNSGPAKARNEGIKIANGDFIVIMDDDCIPEKDWLKKLLSPFADKRIGMSTSYNIWGGTSTAYRKSALKKSGLFDERFPYPYREDTDLVFRVLDAGYKTVQVEADFEHVRHPPESFARYALSRIKVHSVDPLLFKKHPERSKQFFNVRLGFLIDPVGEFMNATGLWRVRYGSSLAEAKKSLSLSSPQDISFIKNRTFIHELAIILLGISYVFAVKISRLYGSLKYGKLLF